MSDPNRPPASARVAMHGYACNLYDTPHVIRHADGRVSLEVGTLPSGSPLLIEPSSLEWWADLESAAREAWCASTVTA